MAIAKYIEEIGRGKDGARALSREQAQDLFGQVLAALHIAPATVVGPVAAGMVVFTPTALQVAHTVLAERQLQGSTT